MGSRGAGEAEMGAASVFRNRWFIPFAACIGIMVGIASVLVLPFAIFLKPVTAEFGWSRGQMSTALAISAPFTIIATPLLGRLIDRYGFRPVLLPAFVLFGILMACFSLLGPQLLVFYALYAATNFVGTSSGPLPYSKAVAAWFDRERGLALGIATAGAGIGTVVMPLIAQGLIDHSGWRAAYIGLAAISAVVGCAVVIFFIREPPGFRAAGPRSASTAPGMSASEAARRSWRFWMLAAIFFLGGVTINGTLAHVVALLTDRGMSPLAAAGVFSASGAAAVIARLIGGWLLDRVHAPYVTAFCMLVSAAGVFLLWSEAAGAALLLGIVCIGIGLGVEIDAMGFLISRYFGLKAFGEIYGWLFPAFTLGVGIGPALMGTSFDRFHSYGPMLSIFCGLLLLDAGLLTLLGDYAYPRQREPQIVPVAAV